MATMHKWLGRNILKESDATGLERDSSAHEFGAARLERKAAEEAAYKNYERKHHRAAAQHHLQYMRAARNSGSHDVAEQHTALFDLHMKALGERPGSTAVSTESSGPGKVDKFHSHPADQLLVSRQKGE